MAEIILRAQDLRAYYVLEVYGRQKVVKAVDGVTLDIYVCNLESPNLLYRNLGGMRFEECARRFGLGFVGASFFAAFARSSLVGCPMRARAISTYSASRSIPMNRKPSATAAFPVEPEPMNGSRTTPLGGVTSRQR